MKNSVFSAINYSASTLLRTQRLLFASSVLVLLATQPMKAQDAKVTAVGLSPVRGGFNMFLKTTNNRSQVITGSRDNTLVVDITNARLNLAQGQNFHRNNPAPGIASVAIVQHKSDRVRIIVTGTTTNSPAIREQERNAQGISLSISSTSKTVGVPNTIAPTLAQKPKVLVPNPNVTIEGKPASVANTAQLVNQSQKVLPRAVAPPVGNIAVANIDSSPDFIRLDTSERVPRLVLRNAPVREVLFLLARAANLNLAFTTALPPGEQQNRTTPVINTQQDDGPKISLDLQDESVEDAFNYVLQVSGLQANRKGRTIFVGTRLPNQVRGFVMRGYRLNQVTVGVALNFLVAQGAESAVSRERTITNVQAVPVGGGQTPATQTQTSTETRIETQRIDFQDSSPPLRGLEVVGDERTNSLTLNGTPQQVALATALLVQLDSRRRQVAVNVKIVDINLSATEDFNASFSFGIGDTYFQSDRGNAILNFGTTNPQSERNRGSSNPPGFSSRFLARLEAQISSGTAKVLTDPTLIVQEGQQASVNLTQETVGNVTTTITDTDGGSRETQTIQKENVGLTVGIKMERIDDNGFLALSVAPVVRAPQDQYETTNGDLIVLISERSLNSGLIRLRDNQTLILTGIIQDSDRTSATKVPILGDIPILGALFRSTNKVNQRQEVIVLLTPQVIDDSERKRAIGNYKPSQDMRQMLERKNERVPGKKP